VEILPDLLCRKPRSLFPIPLAWIRGADAILKAVEEQPIRRFKRGPHNASYDEYVVSVASLRAIAADLTADELRKK
jgi:hypothetical protein